METVLNMRVTGDQRPGICGPHGTQPLQICPLCPTSLALQWIPPRTSPKMPLPSLRKAQQFRKPLSTLGLPSLPAVSITTGAGATYARNGGLLLGQLKRMKLHRTSDRRYYAEIDAGARSALHTSARRISLGSWRAVHRKGRQDPLDSEGTAKSHHARLND